MKGLAKQLIPPPVFRRLRRIRVVRNRRSLARLASVRSPIVVVPDNGAEHFYHFLMDLALPLSGVIEAAPAGARFVVSTTGPFRGLLRDFLGERVDLAEPGDSTQGEAVTLLGMNTMFVDVSVDDVEAFVARVRNNLGIIVPTARNRVLLIERMPPQQFFRTEAKSKGGGASRRHIPNHAELEASLRAAMDPRFELINVRLEEIAFADQVALFGSAMAVIGQHGAGLANGMFMEPGSTMVELTVDRSKAHFQRLARARRQNYMAYLTSGPHADVPVADLLDRLRRLAPLQGVFRER